MALKIEGLKRIYGLKDVDLSLDRKMFPAPLSHRKFGKRQIVKNARHPLNKAASLIQKRLQKRVPALIPDAKLAKLVHRNPNLKDAYDAACRADFVCCALSIEKLGRIALDNEVKRIISSICSIGISAALGMQGDMYQCSDSFTALLYKNALDQANKFAEIGGIEFNNLQRSQGATVAFNGINEALNLAMRYVNDGDFFNFKYIMKMIADLKRSANVKLSDNHKRKLSNIGKKGVKILFAELLKCTKYESIPEILTSDVSVDYDAIPDIKERFKDIVTFARHTHVPLSLDQKEALKAIAQAAIDKSLPKLPKVFYNTIIPNIRQGILDAQEISKLISIPLSSEQRSRVKLNATLGIKMLIEEACSSHDFLVISSSLQQSFELAKIANIEIADKSTIKKCINEAIENFFERIKLNLHPEAKLTQFGQIRDLVFTAGVKLSEKQMYEFHDFAKNEIKDLFEVADASIDLFNKRRLYNAITRLAKFCDYSLSAEQKRQMLNFETAWAKLQKSLSISNN